MGENKKAPPICGCSDRSGYIAAVYKCETCGSVCERCRVSCSKHGHAIRRLTKGEIGSYEDWVRAYGYPA